MQITNLFQRKYLCWNEYIDIAKERAIFVNKDELKQRGWKYVL